MNYELTRHSWVTDILIIMREGHRVTIDEINKDTPWLLNDYNHEKEQYEPGRELDLEFCSESLIYDGQDFELISSIESKMKYAFACMHDDNAVEAVIKEVCPHIETIKVTSQRCTTQYYLQNWMKRFGFSLSDFIFNSRYVVLSCTGDGREFYSMLDNGLINLDNIEHCSEGIDDNEAN